MIGKEGIYLLTGPFVNIFLFGLSSNPHRPPPRVSLFRMLLHPLVRDALILCPFALENQTSHVSITPITKQGHGGALRQHMLRGEQPTGLRQLHLPGTGLPPERIVLHRIVQPNLRPNCATERPVLFRPPRHEQLPRGESLRGVHPHPVPAGGVRLPTDVLRQRQRGWGVVA
jgi:hypothetical protein